MRLVLYTSLLFVCIARGYLAYHYVVDCGANIRTGSSSALRVSLNWNYHSTPFPLTDNEKCIDEVARSAAALAGAAIAKESQNIDRLYSVESKIGSRDIVTKTDKEAQDVIKETILNAFPSHKFLGEEDVPPGAEASKKALQALQAEPSLWIVDPIDGTTNFAHGIPLCGVIIAYAVAGEVVYGCIYDPYRDEYFTAFKNKGSFLNGRRISTCQTDELKNSIVCTGSPPNFKSLEACLRGTAAVSDKVRTMRMLGSAAIMLSWIAVGRVTAYFEADLNPWDLAAGALIIQEAGGEVTDVFGKPYTLSTRLVASVLI